MYFCRKRRLNMLRFIYTFLVITLFISCAETYNVKGSTTVSLLDGSQLYLKTIRDNDFETIDSCSVLHGKFHFEGTLDTIHMASLFIGNRFGMPIVLEKGDIHIRITETECKVGGTELNDSLYSFIDTQIQLSNRMQELYNHRRSQMVLNGVAESEIIKVITTEATQIEAERDKHITDFITDNYNNILGPGIFMMVTSEFPKPTLTPQIEHIMSNATDKFKNHPYVREYYTAATAYEAQMLGLDSVSGKPLPIDSISTRQTAIKPL